MKRRWPRPAIAAGAALAVAGCCAALALAGGVVGSRTIAGAPVVPLNTTTQGRLIKGALYSGFSGAFYLVDLRKGDGLVLETRGGGAMAPCQSLYLPGTDDSTYESAQTLVPSKSENRHNPADVQIWAPVKEAGAYVLSMNDICLSAALTGNGATYTFAASAPHQLRLELDAPARKLAARKVASVVLVGKDADFHPVTGPRVHLFGRPAGGKRIPLASSRLSHGKATFTFTVPASFAGETVRLSVAGGDGTRWAKAYATRRVVVA